MIDIFQSDKALRKQIMSIQTDSTPLEAPKDWKTCNCFAIYELLANPNQIETMKSNYSSGNYGYGHAKQALFELICEKFSQQRNLYNHYINHPEEVEKALAKGAQKASVVAKEVLNRVRKRLGY